jgi:beta-phosphoglucomutase-like phosphatase (HAD superfamily)
MGQHFILFSIDLCGMKNKKEMIKYAARKLEEEEKLIYVVFEDAPFGVAAAKSVGVFAVGIRRIGSREALRRVGADIVVDSLDQMSLPFLLRSVHRHYLQMGCLN